jgi:glycosyltransferase involved in cell wall biosynthesis
MASLVTLEEPCAEEQSCAERGTSVTAIIPTCNRPKLVERAIRSALDQSYSPLEVVLVIDGMDERTRRVAVEMKEPRLRIIELGRNAGAAQARNIGVSMARGEWVAFLDDDDEWLPRKIEVQMQAARRSSALYPVVGSRVVVRSSEFDWISPARLYSAGEPMSEYLFCRRKFVDGASYMQTSTLLMQRELMLKIPFQAKLKRHHDWDWLLRASAQPGVEFHVLSDALAIFNIDDGRTSIGRSLDWKVSRSWAQGIRDSFTPRAYSFFLANECVSRAVKTKAGGAAYVSLVWEFFASGQPTPRSLLSLAGFLCLPGGVRDSMRRSVRLRRVAARASQALQQGLRTDPGASKRIC